MSGARPDTWMPLYIGDYLSDTMHLSHAQHGIYLLLIMAYWRNGGPLPDDAGQLSAIAKCSAADWRKHLPIIARFFQISGGAWAHKRIDAELEGAITKTQERSKAGVNGARRRWQTDGKAIANRMANASQNDAPSPSPKGEAKKESRSETSESAAAREGFSKSERGLGRFAPLEPAPPDTVKPAEAPPPTEEEKAEVAAHVEQAVAALKGAVPKGIRDPAAYAATVKSSKFTNLVREINGWVSTRLDGAARMSAWEVLAEAERSGARSGMTPASRKSFDQLVTAYRTTTAKEAKEAA